VPKGFQIKWNMCLDATDSDKDRYRYILFQSSIQLMHGALRTREENLKQFKLNDRFLVLLYFLAVYVLQLTKTVVPSKIFAIYITNMNTLIFCFKILVLTGRNYEQFR
jgi:hypothetical protein